MFILYIFYFINSKLLVSKYFTLNTNSKDLEVSLSRIYPSILPYYINNKIHDSSIFYIITSF